MSDAGRKKQFNIPETKSAPNELVDASQQRNLSLDVLPTSLGYNLWRLHRVFFDGYAKLPGASDLTAMEFASLFAIGANKGLKQAELARLLRVDPSRVVVLLDSLQRRNLAERIPSITDRRVRAIHLTKSGIRQLRALRKLIIDYEAQFTRMIDPNRFEKAIHVLATLIAANEERGRS